MCGEVIGEFGPPGESSLLGCAFETYVLLSSSPSFPFPSPSYMATSGQTSLLNPTFLQSYSDSDQTGLMNPADHGL